MTEDEIAQAIGWDARYVDRHENDLLDRVVRAVAKAVAAEREACAQVAEKMLRYYTQAVTGVPEAIRARGIK